MVEIPSSALHAFVVLAGAELLMALAAVRSQCFLMNIGMSENALNRWILTCELETKVSNVFDHEFGNAHLHILIREIARILWAVVNSISSPQLTGWGAMGSKLDCANAVLAQESSCRIRSYM